MSVAELRINEASSPRSRRNTICQVVHNLSVGGAELLAVAIARALREEFRFHFVCLDDRGPLADRLVDEGFDVHAVGRGSGIDWSCSRVIREVVKRRRASVIHAHQYTPFFYAALSRFPRFTAPILFTEHGRWFPDRRCWKRAAANRLLLRRVDRVVGVGESVRRAIIDNEGFAAHRVGVVYNGVDPQPSIDRHEARRSLHLIEGEFVVVQIARLDALKDHLTALKAWRRVVDRFADARLLLAGDGPERTRIENWIAELQLQGNVRLLGTRQDVHNLLAAADVGLLSSISEGIPLTILEAMAAGLPVVATAVGGVPEIVAHDETGYLAVSGDDLGLAAHLMRLAADAKLRCTLGSAGRRQVEEKFSRDRMVAQYATIYRDMCRVARS